MGQCSRQEHLKALLKLMTYDFMASNGWLDASVSQYKIKMANLHGESAQVSLEATEQSKSLSSVRVIPLRTFRMVPGSAFSSGPLP